MEQMHQLTKLNLNVVNKRKINSNKFNLKQKMKKLVLLTVLAFSGIVGFAQKIGHVDVAEVFKVLPAKIAADKEMEAAKATYDKAITEKENALKTRYEELQKQVQAAKPSDEQMKKYQEEIQTKDQEIQDLKKDAYAKLSEKQDALVAPLVEKLQAAIDKVAKAQGINYVLDAAKGAGLVSINGGNDLTAAVKAELGIK